MSIVNKKSLKKDIKEDKKFLVFSLNILFSDHRYLTNVILCTSIFLMSDFWVVRKLGGKSLEPNYIIWGLTSALCA